MASLETPATQAPRGGVGGRVAGSGASSQAKETPVPTPGRMKNGKAAAPSSDHCMYAQAPPPPLTQRIHLQGHTHQ